ncbi:TonB-dependent receptor [Edaphosphingomonas haloaromaticamans]|nr:TonB-dependent receptor [Sphingomonas haloaromaticamans]
MAAATLMPPGRPNGPRRRKQSPITFGRVLAVVGVGLVLVIGYSFLGQQTISDRPNEMKTTTVILPPPPPPPPPPKEQVEQPPEPTIAPPIEQPLDTPPPPDQANSDPTPGDNALTAREGAGPSNYGLARGDGSGTRIGGRPGGGTGDAFRAYAVTAQACIQRAAQADRELTRGNYRAQLSVTMGTDGRIATARVTSGVDDRRAARIQTVLSGVQCQAPPAGLPAMRLELSTRSGG